MEITSYTGMKAGEEGEYTRVSTTRHDEPLLDRFWIEACSQVQQGVRRYLHESEINDTFSLTLHLPDLYNAANNFSINGDLFGFIVNSIAAKWYVITNKDEARESSGIAKFHLEQALKKISYKTPPVRPTYEK